LREQNIEIDLALLPLDDKPTYEMLARGDAGGVFQFESVGMRDVLRQMRPDRFEDLIAGVALYRPGPMANIPDYCKRKHGEAWAAPHPSLHDVLSETYGIMVYQEQVMQIAQTMGGYSLGAADLLRRAMGKKIRSEMEAQRALFVGGAIGRGIEPDKAGEVFDLMAKFADYGFNKSHAAAYALVAYQTAWMKANHPVAFAAACMSLAINNTERLAALKQDAERAGIKLLPPDINRSGPDFTVERQEGGGFAIRYALAAVKKVGLAAMQSVVASRAARDFEDLTDFATRVDPRSLNKMQIENLARAGAFDRLDPNRARVFAGAEAILRRAQADASEAASGQIGLFGGGKPEALRLPETADWPQLERLGYEAEAIGFHLTAHPLDAYSQVLRRIGVVRLAEVEARGQAGLGRARLAGIVVGEKQRTTQRGTRMCWLRISDASGSLEVTLFSEVLSRVQDLIRPGSAVLVTCDLKADGEALRLTAADVTALDDAARDAGAGIRVWLERTEAVAHIRSLLAREGKGRGRVVLVPDLGSSREVEVALPGAFNVSPKLSQALKLIPGVQRIEDI
jgi:DNA polymerase-3 subunit alpha